MSSFLGTCVVLKKIANKAKKNKIAQHADGNSFYNFLKSSDFIFILHLMKEIMGITNVLCQALQKGSHDVVNFMRLVRSTKALIQDLEKMVGISCLLVCEKHEIEILDLNDCHLATIFRHSRLEENQVTIEHYF